MCRVSKYVNSFKSDFMILDQVPLNRLFDEPLLAWMIWGFVVIFGKGPAASSANRLAGPIIIIGLVAHFVRNLVSQMIECETERVIVLQNTPYRLPTKNLTPKS